MHLFAPFFPLFASIAHPGTIAIELDQHRSRSENYGARAPCCMASRTGLIIRLVADTNVFHT